MKKILLIITITLICIPPTTLGQSNKSIMFTNEETDTTKNERLSFEDFFSLVTLFLEEENTEEFIDIEYLENRLKAVYDAPVNWNTTNREELRGLMIISEAEIDELLYYAGEYGPVHSIYELQLVENLSQPLKTLLPNILVADSIPTHYKWSDKLKYGTHYVSLHSNGTLEKKKGFIDNSFAGLPMALSAKYKFTSANLKASISMKSDAGEPFVSKGSYRRYGFDKYRCFAEASNIPHFGNILIGSYKAFFGEGLIFGSRNWGSKSQQLLNYGQQAKITGYGGSSPLPTLNGAAYSISKKLVNANIFYGISLLDADTTGQTWHSISTSGYHRTDNELIKQNTLSLHTIGGNISFGRTRWNVGLNGYASKFSLPATLSDGTWNAYDFTGKWQWGLSAYYHFKKKKISMNGELAVVNSAVATNNNIIFLISSDYTIGFNHRYYSPSYHAFWANGYSSTNGINGEHGAGFAFNIPLYKKLSLELYTDGYKTLWATTLHPANAIGFETRMNVKYNERLNYYELSLRYKSKPNWEKDNVTIPVYGKENTGALYFRARYSIENSTFTSGIQANIYFLKKTEDKAASTANKTIGWLIYQDVASKFLNNTLDVKTRIAIFNAPSWQNRFYLFEHNIAEYYYSPALYGSAVRWYLLISYKTPVKLQLSFRISQTYHYNKDTIGSGPDEIYAPHRTEMQGTISYTF